jgi:hypothetical protein
MLDASNQDIIRRGRQEIRRNKIWGEESKRDRFRRDRKERIRELGRKNLKKSRFPGRKWAENAVF